MGYGENTYLKGGESVAKVKRRTLREKTIKKYIDAGGVYCPYCENENVNWSSVEIEGAGAYQQGHCPECGARWANSYALVSIVELDKPEKGGAGNGKGEAGKAGS